MTALHPAKAVLSHHMCATACLTQHCLSCCSEGCCCFPWDAAGRRGGRVIPTLHPAPSHRAQEVGVEALRLLHSVEDPADVHHLWERRDKAGVTALLPGLLGWTGLGERVKTQRKWV